MNIKFLDQIISIDYQVKKYLKLIFKIKQIVNNKKNNFKQKSLLQEIFTTEKELNINNIKLKLTIKMIIKISIRIYRLRLIYDAYWFKIILLRALI